MAEKRAFQLGILNPVKIPLPNSNNKVFISKESDIEMLVGVSTLPPSLTPTLQKIAILGLKTGLWQ